MEDREPEWSTQPDTWGNHLLGSFKYQGMVLPWRAPYPLSRDLMQVGFRSRTAWGTQLRPPRIVQIPKSSSQGTSELAPQVPSRTAGLLCVLENRTWWRPQKEDFLEEAKFEQRQLKG